MPTKMAEKIDCEGNIISPLGNFKKISPASSTCVVQLPVPVCSSAPCTVLTTSTTVSYATRTPFTLPTTSCPASVASLISAGAKAPVTGGVRGRGYEYVSNDDLMMIYTQAVKIKKERDLVLKQNRKLKKILKSYRRKENDRQQLSRPPAPVMMCDNATQADSDTTTVSPFSSSWLTMLLQLRAQSSTELQEARATNSLQTKKVLAQKKEIKRLTFKVATLTHDNNQAHLALQQNMSVYSSSITGSVFDTTVSDVPEEEGVTPAPTLPPPAELPKRQDSILISRMLDSVDRLAQVYSPADRYHKPCNVNLSMPRNDVEPDKLLNYEFAALWMHANDPTPEEEAEYDRYLEKELRPPPIHSPHLRKLAVNWNRLNPGQYKNLPEAEKFPVQGCSQDPDFYLQEDVSGSYPSICRIPRWKYNRFPFGYLYGFQTNMGVVSVPDVAIHGYRCSEGSGRWYIDAMG